MQIRPKSEIAINMVICSQVFVEMTKWSEPFNF